LGDPPYGERLEKKQEKRKKNQLNIYIYI